VVWDYHPGNMACLKSLRTQDEWYSPYAAQLKKREFNNTINAINLRNRGIHNIQNTAIVTIDNEKRKETNIHILPFISTWKLVNPMRNNSVNKAPGIIKIARHQSSSTKSNHEKGEK
jgi:hypothetical protein